MNYSRLYEFYRHVVRPDMLALFSHTAELKSLEVSIVLDAATALQNDVKYKSACVLELLSGQRPTVSPCDINKEGIDSILYGDKKTTAAGRRGAEADRFRAAMIANRGKAVTKEDFRRAATSASGLKLENVLTGPDMYYFLEKLREFYLPDLMSMEYHQQSQQQGAAWTERPRKYLASQFQVWTKAYSTLYPSRRSLKATENPLEAVATYYLKSGDLLKFPDIELFFEPLSSVISSTKSAGSQALGVYIRPTVTVTPGAPQRQPLVESDTDSETHSSRLGLGLPTPFVDRLQVMNYLLSILFNPFARRLEFKLKAPKAPPPPAHVGLLPVSSATLPLPR